MASAWINRNIIHANGSHNAATQVALLAVPASKRFKLHFALINTEAGANTVSLHVGTFAILTAHTMADNSTEKLDWNEGGWCYGALGDDFLITLTAATAVTVNYGYTLWDS
jgi:hypothetical protein